jgi:hypothetical protein
MTEAARLKWEIFKELNRTGTALRSSPPYDSPFALQIAQRSIGGSVSLTGLLQEVETVFASITKITKAKRRK